jgi:uncharacterized membrane protein YhaH (DUF805 family)
MPISHLFFGFTGRINRAEYWLAILIYFVVLVVAALILTAASADAVTAWVNYDLSDMSGTLIILYAVELVLFVSQVAITVKRLHDRDKSAWWVLLFSVLPGVIFVISSASMDPYAFDYSGPSPILSLIAAGFALWGLVEVGFLRGTPGPNRYGSDPLERLQDPPYPGGPLR